MILLVRPFIVFAVVVSLASCGGGGSESDTTTFDGHWIARTFFAAADCTNTTTENPLEIELDIAQVGQSISAVSTSLDGDSVKTSSYSGSTDETGRGFSIDAATSTEQCSGQTKIIFFAADLDSGTARAVVSLSSSCTVGDDIFARLDTFCGEAVRR